jgi:hypothetical protein
MRYFNLEKITVSLPSIHRLTDRVIGLGFQSGLDRVSLPGPHFTRGNFFLILDALTGVDDDNALLTLESTVV